MVNFPKIFWFFSFDFCQNFNVRTFSWWLSIRGIKVFWRDIQKIFPQNFTLVLLDGFLDGFLKFQLFIVKICILIWYFWYFSKIIVWACSAYVETIFIAHWAYEETIMAHWAYEEQIFAHAQPGVKCEVFTCTSMLSIRGTNFIAHWAYMERVSSLAEHTRNGFHRWLRIRENV